MAIYNIREDIAENNVWIFLDEATDKIDRDKLMIGKMSEYQISVSHTSIRLVMMNAHS